MVCSRWPPFCFWVFLQNSSSISCFCIPLFLLIKCYLPWGMIWVMDSILWVRCASGNVLRVFPNSRRRKTVSTLFYHPITAIWLWTFYYCRFLQSSNTFRHRLYLDNVQWTLLDCTWTVRELGFLFHLQVTRPKPPSHFRTEPIMICFTFFFIIKTSYLSSTICLEFMLWHFLVLVIWPCKLNEMNDETNDVHRMTLRSVQLS